LVRAGSDAADRFAVPLLTAATALSPSPTLWSGTRTTGAAAPSHRATLTLLLATLVTCELARLLALFTGRELLRTEGRCAELRPRNAELGTRSVVGRTGCTEATAAASATTAAAPATRAVLIAKLLRRRPRFVRTGRRTWSGVARRFARGLVRRLARGP